MKLFTKPFEVTAPQLNSPPPKSGDPRLFELLGKRLGENTIPKVAIIGFPCEQGIARNNGRLGAKEAPDEIRKYFYRLAPDPRCHSDFSKWVELIFDVGNLVLPADLESAQLLLGEVVGELLSQGVIPIILGGGHETTFGHFLGYVKAGKKVGIINWDAHLDVRPLVDGKGHSGSPFRQALEHQSQTCVSYVAAGVLPHAVSQEHLRYVSENGARYYFRSELTTEQIERIYWNDLPSAFVTFDLDAVDQAYAPGVSAPATDGLVPELWWRAAYQAGRATNVTSIDVVELNPKFDRDGQTARLAALTLWYFIRGLVDRGMV